MRRFTRLTNAFSKKVENHAAMVALHYMYYNFGRAHSSLGKLTTPGDGGWRGRSRLVLQRDRGAGRGLSYDSSTASRRVRIARSIWLQSASA